MGLNIPDWQRRAIRSAVALGIIGLAAQGILVPPGLPDEYKDEWMSLAGWAGSIAIMVNAPVIGKMSQVCADRSIGTIVGGLLAYLAFQVGLMLVEDPFLFDGYEALIAALAGAFSCWVSTTQFGSDLTARIFALTFFLVINGGGRFGSPLILSLARIGSILAGVFIMLILGVLILPRSATVESHRCIQKALKSLKNLNSKAWRYGPDQKAGDIGRTGSEELKATFRDGYMPVPCQESGLEWNEEEEEAEEEECEKALGDIYAALDKCKENMDVTKLEIYVWHGYGHYIFMPGMTWFSGLVVRLGGWRLSVRQMSSVCTCLRRMTRLLWALHLDISGVLDKELQAAVRPMFQQLEGCAQSVIADLIDAFPGERSIAIDNLVRFQALVKELQLAWGNTRTVETVQQLAKHEGAERKKLTRPSLHRVSANFSPDLRPPALSRKSLTASARLPLLGAHSEEVSKSQTNRIAFVSHLSSARLTGGAVTVATLEVDPLSRSDLSEVLVRDVVEDPQRPASPMLFAPRLRLVAENSCQRSLSMSLPAASAPSIGTARIAREPLFRRSLDARASLSHPQAKAPVHPHASLTHPQATAPARTNAPQRVLEGALKKEVEASRASLTNMEAWALHPSSHPAPSQPMLEGVAGDEAGVSVKRGGRSQEADTSVQAAEQSSVCDSHGAGGEGAPPCLPSEAAEKVSSCEVGGTPIPILDNPKLSAEARRVAQVRLAVLEFVIEQIGAELEDLVLAIAGLMARLPYPLS